MIKLERTVSPLCLSPANVTALTLEFKATKRAVWNFRELREALLAISYSKCAYCECRLSVESKYLEVEHFKHKDGYEDDVVAWENLLPACKRCNLAKGTHDVVTEPIVDPFRDSPRKHLSFAVYRLRSKTARGSTTIDVLDLNDSEKLVKVRFEIGEGIQKSVEAAGEKLDRYRLTPTMALRNRLITHVRLLLAECQAPAAYAATAATVLHQHPDYRHVKSEMKRLTIWPAELSKLDSQSQRYIL